MSKNNRFQICFVSILILISFSGTALCQEIINITRQDKKTVPLSVYFPDKNSCRGIIIISHGAGASEKVYSYIGKAMSSEDYLTVVVGHQESGFQALNQKVLAVGPREGLLQLITEPEAYRGRFMDIAAAKQWAQERCDAKESILIGHSMGAATTMIEAGAKNKLGVSGSNAFDIYIALSPQGPGTIFPENAWREISKPVLLMTGTNDWQLDVPNWKNRTEPFYDMPAGCKWLGIIKGSTHLNFAGIGLSGKTENLTVKTIQAFLAGVHQHDCKMPQREQGIEIIVK